MNPFDNPPYAIPSMNQVRIVDLPGMFIPLAWRNKSGYQLLGSRFLAAQIRRQAHPLRLPTDLPDSDLIRQFDACFTGDTATRATAQAIAEEYGRKLALHLLALLRGDPINRVVRPAWSAEHWEFWTQIHTVYTGGGIMAGHLGAIAAATAQAVIRAHGFPAFTVTVPPHAAELPLYGAARLAPPNAAMLAFDFGQTAVKRAIVHQPDSLEILASLPTPCARLPFGRNESAATHTLNRLLEITTETWTAVTASGVSLSDKIAIVLACYLLAGQPRQEDWSCYGRLQQLTPHLQTYLSQQISQRLQRPIQAHLLHDGQAAAMPFAGQQHTAVITFGTALGIGFPPPQLTVDN